MFEKVEQNKTRNNRDFNELIANIQLKLHDKRYSVYFDDINESLDILKKKVKHQIDSNFILSYTNIELVDRNKLEFIKQDVINQIDIFNFIIKDITKEKVELDKVFTDIELKLYNRSDFKEYYDSKITLIRVFNNYKHDMEEVLNELENQQFNTPLIIIKYTNFFIRLKREFYDNYMMSNRT
jgi:hypothetical protein